ncbi:MAG: hypothetical protein ACR2MO_12075 [Acidimicrobiales bacterium]
MRRPSRRDDAVRSRAEPEQWEPEVWVEDEVEGGDDDELRTGTAPGRARPERSVPDHVKAELHDQDPGLFDTADRLNALA